MDFRDPPIKLLLRQRDGDDDEDTGKELLKLLQDPFAGQLQAASLVSALAVSLGFMGAMMLLFSILRPYHQSLYAPKVKHADEKHAPPAVGKKPWSWFTPVWKSSEEQLIRLIGMDATVFLRFTSMCRNLFLVLTVLGCGILIPIHHQNSTNEDWLEKNSPLNVSGDPIWAQVVVAWLFFLITAGFLWWNYRKVMQLRWKYFESEEYQQSLHSRTLMGRSDEGIARIIDNVVPNSSFARTVVARNVKDLPNLIQQHENAVRKLEKVLAKYLKNPDKLPPGRPTCKPSRKDPSYDTYPRGQQIDAIEYYTSRIRQLEVEIKEVRSSVDKRGTMPYGFASYADIQEAHNIAYACRKKKPNGATIVLAPRPNDIIWVNMPLSKAARSSKGWIASFWIVLLTFLWIAPNAMIAIFLVNLSNLGKFWPGFQQSLEENTKVWGAVQGILAPAIMSLVYLVLPMIFRRLQIRAGDKTKTGRERHVLAKLYAFFFFNNLLVFSVFSVIWTFVANIVNDTTNSNIDAWEAIVKENIFESIFVSLCQNSPFWVTYLLQRQLGAAVDIAQLYCLLEAFFLKKLGSPTPRKLIELTAPPPFEYASYYNYFLFYATVTLTFAPIQPLVLPATALYFIIDYYLKKYLILYRFVTKTESGGVFWRVLFNRFIFAMLFSHLVVLLTTWVRGNQSTHIQFFAVCPLPVLTIIFKIYCGYAFDNKIQFYSTYVKKHHEANLKEERQRSEKLASRFGHPALYRPLITPMVNQKAQNLLPAIYTGRLTDGRDGGHDDFMSVSGYSDMYALNNMQGGKPGKATSGVPGFEYVPESQMDFEHYKNRAEFAEDHGGGEIFGRQGEIARPGTPGSNAGWAGRPESPFSERTGYGPGSSKRSDTGYHGYHHPAAPSMSEHNLTRTQTGMYSHDNGSASGLVRNAAASPMSPPEPYHDAPLDHGGSGRASPMGGRMTPSRSRSPGPATGFMGPRGYSGLAQAEYTPGSNEEDNAQYDYFRGGSRPGRRAPGQGW